MGDTIEEISNPTEKPTVQENAPSINPSANPLKTTKPSENISITPLNSEEELEKLHESVDSKCSVEREEEERSNSAKEKIKENVIAEQKEKKGKDKADEGVKVDKLKKEVFNSEDIVKDKNRKSDSMPCCLSKPREKIIRNQSDIFSLKDSPTTLQTSIFSVNGSPSRRVFRKFEQTESVFPRNEEPPSDKLASLKESRITRENYNDEKRPSSSYRNPLTGTGLSSNDEYKSKGVKRKDGNPLLGLGYDSEVASVTSSHRIPPGGYSHRLW